MGWPCTYMLWLRIWRSILDLKVLEENGISTPCWAPQLRAPEQRSAHITSGSVKPVEIPLTKLRWESKRALLLVHGHSPWTLADRTGVMREKPGLCSSREELTKQPSIYLCWDPLPHHPQMSSFQVSHSSPCSITSGNIHTSLPSHSLPSHPAEFRPCGKLAGPLVYIFLAGSWGDQMNKVAVRVWVVCL